MAQGLGFQDTSKLQTDILPVEIGILKFKGLEDTSKLSYLDEWDLEIQEDSTAARHLRRAAHELTTTDIPVAFPTETVYGLGADATRSSAVRGIYRAKQRPSDNPLIVHVHSLRQLRSLLRPEYNHVKNEKATVPSGGVDKTSAGVIADDDPIPQIYRSLIAKFWPGPLTLIMPNPRNSVLAPEVTAGLDTFGVRMPRNALALALIKLAGVPLAAPSANASTKPSPTAAEHVKHDLEGRIATILDGGPCEVGVESTVVDGLCDPPLVLRPGGISIETLRTCPGWEMVDVGYADKSQSEAQPKAPGMKYRHYSPRATLVLFEFGSMPGHADLIKYAGVQAKIGILRTKFWPHACGFDLLDQSKEGEVLYYASNEGNFDPPGALHMTSASGAHVSRVQVDQSHIVQIWEMSLGKSAENIAKGLFSALRELDLKEVHAILVEGIDEQEGDLAAAVMNRLRKAAEVAIG